MTVEPILSVRHLVKEFGAQLQGRPAGHREGPGGQRHRLRSAAWRDARPGGGVGLRPSTTGRTLLRLTEPTGGVVMFEGEDLATLKSSQLRKARRDLQIVFQDPCASLNPRLPIQRHRVRAAGHPRPPQGQAQGPRARAARHRRPEPRARQPACRTSSPAASANASASPGPWPSSRRCCSTSRSALDVSIQAGVVNLLTELQDRLGWPYLFIAHDLSVVRHLGPSR